MGIATKNKWQSTAMRNPIKLNISIDLDKSDFEKIIVGVIPEVMEDKWFIYYENGWLHIHRSWTGFEIFKLNIEYINEDKYHISELFIEKEFTNLLKNENNKTDLTYLNSLIKTLINRDIFSVS